jgi:hypothetical protein
MSVYQPQQVSLPFRVAPQAELAGPAYSCAWRSVPSNEVPQKANLLVLSVGRQFHIDCIDPCLFANECGSN